MSLGIRGCVASLDTICSWWRQLSTSFWLPTSQAKIKKVSITSLPLKKVKPQICDTTKPLLEIIIDLSTFHQVSCVASREFTGSPFLQRLFPKALFAASSFLAVQVRNPDSEVPFRITVFRSGWNSGQVANKFTQLWSKNLHDLYTMCLRNQGHSKFKFISTIALFTSFAKRQCPRIHHLQ